MKTAIRYTLHNIEVHDDKAPLLSSTMMMRLARYRPRVVLVNIFNVEMGMHG